MSSIRLKEIVLPDFGVPDTIPAINDATYGARLAARRADSSAFTPFLDPHL